MSLQLSQGSSLQSVQWLRLVAATLVVVYHTDVQLMRLFEGSRFSANFGASGVDLFFVISGFVMVVATEGRPTVFVDFMARRVIRIVPLYWLCSAMVLLILWRAPELLSSTVLDLGHTVSSFLFVPYRHPVLGVERPLLVLGWTLQYEMFFYLLFGLLLPLSLGRRILAIGFIFGLIAAAAAVQQSGSGLIAFYGAPIVFEFVAGMSVGWLYVRRFALAPAALIAAGAAALLVFAAGVATGVSEQTSRVLFWGPPAAIGLLSAVLIERQRGWPYVPLLVRLGDASYSIYLSHLFVLATVTRLIKSLGLASFLGVLPIRIVMVAATLAVGLLIHAVIERPLQAATARLWSRFRAGGNPAAAAPRRQ